MSKILSATVASIKAAVGIRPPQMTVQQLPEEMPKFRLKAAAKYKYQATIDAERAQAVADAERLGYVALDDSDPEAQIAASKKIGASIATCDALESALANTDKGLRKDGVRMLPALLALQSDGFKATLANLTKAENSVRKKLAGIFADEQLGAVVFRAKLVMRAQAYVDAFPPYSLGDPAADELHPDIKPEQLIKAYDLIVAAIAQAEAFRAELAG